MTKEEAKIELDKLVKEAYKNIGDAEKLADEFGLEFDFGVRYGMSGTYYPKKMTKSEAISLIETDAVTDDNREQVLEALKGGTDRYGDELEQGWVSSSDHC